MEKFRICKICFIEKPITEFVPHNMVKSGYLKTCKECEKIKRRKIRQKLYYNPIDEKKCHHCDKIKLKEEFYINTKDTTGLSSNCKKCTRLKAKVYKETHPEIYEKIKENNRNNSNKKELAAKKRMYLLEHPEQKMFSAAKRRAKKKNIEFNIEVSDIIIPDICPILKIKLKTGTKGNYKYSPSLDRIDNSKGYIKENVQVISSLANTMKNEASFEELKTFANYIINNY